MDKTTRSTSIGLGLLQTFIALGAIPAGIMLIMDPSGSSMGWTTADLAIGPFTNYLIPGIVLVLVNGLGSLAGAVATFRQQRWAPEIAMALGLFLMAWIAIQYLIIGYSWLQAVFFLVGLVEFLLGWRIRQQYARSLPSSGSLQS